MNLERVVAGPSDSTIKRLFAVSSNTCAFPACSEPLEEGETIVGEICHIKSAGRGHGRYDPDQSDEERHGFDNLILLCRKHHKIVDSDVNRYPASLLTEFKKSHEANAKKRFDISDEVAHRVGEMLANFDVPPRTAAPVAGAPYPDMTLRELFFHIRPDLIEDLEAAAWKEVGREVMDHFSTGRLKVWGRPVCRPNVRRQPMKLVDEARYWAHAEFTYWFLKEDGRENSHTWVKTETRLPDYCDLQVNRGEAMAIWPEAGRAGNDRTEIMLLDAARRAYSATRGMPAAEHAEMAENSPEQVMTWYCIFFGQHYQLYGARRPSMKIEPVSIGSPTKDFHLHNGELTLRDRNGPAVWENLRIKLDDMKAAIKQLQGYDRE
jgi:hypothetical protein